MADEYKCVTHCIFDMDGLLLDTERLYTEATQRIVSEYGKTYSWDVKVSVMGLQTQQVAEKIVAALDLPMSWQEYSQRQREETAKLFPNAQLLPDTEKVYGAIIRQIANSFGKDYPDEVRMKVLGSTERNTAQIAVQEMQLPITSDEFLELFRKISFERLGITTLLPGVERLLRHLHDHNVPLALATSSSKDMYELKTTNHKELFEVFNHIVCGSTDPEVKAGKPAPDIFLIAAARFPDKPCPETCLVFEDAPNGVMAARSAGMQVVMVPDSRVPAELREGATKVLQSMCDFKPEEFGLPPFSEC